MNEQIHHRVKILLLKLVFNGLWLGLLSCTKAPETVRLAENELSIVVSPVLPAENGNTIRGRFQPPVGYQSISYEPNSYAEYLRTLPLKTAGTLVRLFNQDIKPNTNIYEAVIDLPIGKRNLHQCADAIIRLRAEYLFQEKRYSDIHFNFTNGFRVDYSRWMQGDRMAVNGNKCQWIPKAQPSNSQESFWRYLETIFTYAGTLSLSKELTPVDAKDMEVGDVFIQGGSPGHAIVVVDMAENKETKEKIFMLAQSYMPAQEIQILKNNNDPSLSPWYRLTDEPMLRTPEWGFELTDLKRFE